MIYVIGGEGFVGSAFARLFAAHGIEHRIITEASYDTWRGTACDILINANGNSKKLLATQAPLTDFDQSVRSVAETIEAFRAPTYVMLSSGDVYPSQATPEVTREDQAIEPALQSRYGLHKHLAEMLVRGTQKRWLIIRMGGFVGPGLKKNAIFDMMAGAPVWLGPESRLQFISTDRAAALVWQLLERGVHNEIINLGGRGLVHLGALHRQMKSTSTFQKDAPIVRYELSLDKLSQLAGGELPNCEAEVAAFLAAALSGRNS